MTMSGSLAQHSAGLCAGCLAAQETCMFFAVQA
jgi:hypothetical protein